MEIPEIRDQFDVAQQGLDAIRPGSIEHWADLPAFTLDRVTDTTGGREDLLATRQIPCLVRQRTVLGELCLQRSGDRLGLDRRQINGSFNARVAVEFAPRFAGAMIQQRA